ncbi:hypothetical protein F4560_004514 [Saccharothrix ecbatanensis]|uniref:Uncharacterized protein n=1 Tax=Saccharothrix ecbatanensis TaxID=1105145 RepID=A0A7W9M2A7_9PSEU|nr:hypothetical protein [Saccharothrix ecbatanensis]MBB5804746.1 hypothetical protein [Saccharothrix ecbatanensis]
MIQHWNETGRMSDQAVRAEFYSRLDNLHGMCQSCNTSKGAEESGTGVWRIDDGFKGPDGT